MADTNVLGSPEAQLGSVVLGQSSPALSGTVGIRVRPASARELIVSFAEPVTEEALDGARYSLWTINQASHSLPSVVSGAFADPDRTSVLLTLEHGLTVGGEYSLQASRSILAESGELVSTAGCNFTASAPDAPVPCGAYLSLRSHLDVSFDRPVGQFSPSATATVSADGGAPVALALVPWTSSIPETSVRFALGGSFPSGSSYVVSYSGVADASLNVTSGTAALRTPPGPSHTLASLTTPAVMSSRVRSSDDGSRVTTVDAWFSCPVAASAGTASAVLPHSHASPDTANAPAIGAVTDLATFFAAMTAVRAAFNAHVLQDGVHGEAPRQAGLLSLCSAVNDAVEKFNDHVMDGSAHAYQDRDLVVGAAPARDLATAVARLSELAAKMNTHRTRTVSAVAAHALDDTDYPVPALAASSLDGVSAYADDLKVRLAMHVSLQYHPSVRQSSIPSRAFCLERMVYALASTDADCVAQLHEASLKLSAHMGSPRHSYAFRHASELPGVSPASVAAAHPVADSLAARYLEHAGGAGYAVAASAWDHSQAAGPPSLPSDGHYRVTYRVQNSSRAPSVTLSVSTTTAEPTPIAVAASFTALRADPAPSASRISESSLSIRHDGPAELAGASLSLASGEAVRAGGAVLALSPQALVAACWELARAYTAHASASTVYDRFGQALPAMHQGAPSDDIDLSGYPAGVDGAVLLLNEVLARFNRHVVTGTHLADASGYAVQLQPADGPASAAVLIEALRAALKAHNVNESQHQRAGWDSLPPGFADTVEISVPAMPAAQDLVATVARPGASRAVVVASAADSPRIASAEIVPGYDPRRRRLGPDRMLLSFTKPMSLRPLLPSNFTVSGSVTVASAEWVGPREAVLQIVGTASGSAYSVSANGVYDEAGNALVPTPTAPHLVLGSSV